MNILNLVKPRFAAAYLLLQLSPLSFQSRGAPGDLDLSFDAGSSRNGTVKAAVLQPDGKVIIGGQFTTVKGFFRTNIARLNADGSGDATFNPGTKLGAVSSLALQADGKVLVASAYDDLLCDEFECYVVQESVVTRLNPNGSVDNTFTPITRSGSYAGSSFDGVSFVVVQPDGKVVTGGWFASVNGTNRSGIARLNADGTLDSSFNPGTRVYYAAA